jgi:uncharacterized DUF497 family protein
MLIVWDEPKRKANLAKHGLDLALARSLDWEGAIVVPGHAGRDGRRRFRAIGWLRNDLVSLTFSRLGSEAISAISLRRASRSERRLYEEAST